MVYSKISHGKYCLKYFEMNNKLWFVFLICAFSVHLIVLFFFFLYMLTNDCRYRIFFCFLCKIYEIKITWFLSSCLELIGVVKIGSTVYTLKGGSLKIKTYLSTIFSDLYYQFTCGYQFCGRARFILCELFFFFKEWGNDFKTLFKSHFYENICLYVGF